MPVDRIFKGALALVVYYRKELAKALLLPITAYLLINYLLISPANTGVSLLGSLMTMALQCLIAVTVHRIVLLGPQAVEVWGPKRWTARDSRFLLHMIGLVCMITIACMPFMVMVVATPAITILGAIFCYVLLTMRLSLVFPAIAMDREFGFKEAWQLSGRYLKEMFFTVAIVPFIVMLPAIPLALLVSFDLTLVSIVTTIWPMLATVMIVAALSVTYKGIIDGESGKAVESSIESDTEEG